MKPEWFLAIIFTLGGLFNGWVGYARWDGLRQAFIGLLGAMLLGMLIQRKWPST